MYEHTDHVMDEQMNFIVHFDWMSFSDGVVPIYSLRSRHEKRQDKKHSHYASHAGQTHVTPATCGWQLRPGGPHTLSPSPQTLGALPSQWSGSPCLSLAELCLASDLVGLPGRHKGAAEGSLPSRANLPHLQVGCLSS